MVVRAEFFFALALQNSRAVESVAMLGVRNCSAAESSTKSGGLRMTLAQIVTLTSKWLLQMISSSDCS
jgi:hypothetical protein